MINSKVFFLDIDTKSINYEKMINQEVDSSVLPRSINIDNSVSSPVGTTVSLTEYQVNYYLKFLIQSYKTKYFVEMIKC